jgi:hypothetical protein
MALVFSTEAYSQVVNRNSGDNTSIYASIKSQCDMDYASNRFEGAIGDMREKIKDKNAFIVKCENLIWNELLENEIIAELEKNPKYRFNYTNKYCIEFIVREKVNGTLGKALLDSLKKSKSLKDPKDYESRLNADMDEAFASFVSSITNSIKKEYPEGVKQIVTKYNEKMQERMVNSLKKNN